MVMCKRHQLFTTDDDDDDDNISCLKNTNDYEGYVDLGVSTHWIQDGHHVVAGQVLIGRFQRQHAVLVGDVGEVASLLVLPGTSREQDRGD